VKQEWQKSPALGPGKQTAKLGLVGINRKKISQIINAYLGLPFFLLIILWYQEGTRNHQEIIDFLTLLETMTSEKKEYK
jgi:hypothetical protein